MNGSEVLGGEADDQGLKHPEGYDKIKSTLSMCSRLGHGSLLAPLVEEGGRCLPRQLKRTDPKTFLGREAPAMTDNPQNPNEKIDSDEIEDLQQDDNLTPADRMDLIANSVAADVEMDAAENSARAFNGGRDTPGAR